MSYNPMLDDDDELDALSFGLTKPVQVSLRESVQLKVEGEHS